MLQGKTMVRKVVASVVTGVASLMAFGVLAQPAGAATHNVSIIDFSFSPKALTVQTGETVVWTNNGTVAHTVTADDGSFNSGSIAPGFTFSHTFSSAGTVPYYCAFHGASGGVGMAGRITVQAAVVATTTPTTTPPVATTSTASSSTATPTTAASPVAEASDASSATPTTGVRQLAHTGSHGATAALVGVALIAIGFLAAFGARRRARIETRA